jgi:hypothetical protein
MVTIFFAIVCTTCCILRRRQQRHSSVLQTQSSMTVVSSGVPATSRVFTVQPLHPPGMITPNQGGMFVQGTGNPYPTPGWGGMTSYQNPVAPMPTYGAPPMYSQPPPPSGSAQPYNQDSHLFK